MLNWAILGLEIAGGRERAADYLGSLEKLF